MVALHETSDNQQVVLSRYWNILKGTLPFKISIFNTKFETTKTFVFNKR